MVVVVRFQKIAPELAVDLLSIAVVVAINRVHPVVTINAGLRKHSIRVVYAVDRD